MRRSSKIPFDQEVTAAPVRKNVTRERQVSTETMMTITQYLATIGRKGGIKGGKARARILSPERRVEIATKAAEVRWKRA
jgi:hypothetical protein